MPPEANNLSRRRFMKKAVQASGAAVLAGWSSQQRPPLAESGGDARPPAGAAPDRLQTGTIGKLRVGRLICGGNLFSGFAHSRNLIYVSNLMKQYFTPEKIMDTLQACEESGVNTAIMQCDNHILKVLKRYRKERHGKIQWIAQAYPRAKDPTGNVKLARDGGAVGAFIQGLVGDRFVREGRLELIGKIIAFMKDNGLAAGVGSHRLEVPKAVEKAGLEPDFYFKTFNDVGYYSEKPKQIADAMKAVNRPWIAFKVLGAGVVRPAKGFRLALEMGADFLCVGMFDFQVKQDAATVKQLLAKDLPRQRPWRS